MDEVRTWLEQVLRSSLAWASTSSWGRWVAMGIGCYVAVRTLVLFWRAGRTELLYGVLAIFAAGSLFAVLDPGFLDRAVASSAVQGDPSLWDPSNWKPWIDEHLILWFRALISSSLIRALTALVVVYVFLRNGAFLLMKAGKAFLYFLPVILFLAPAFYFLEPRTFDPESQDCRELTAQLPSATDLGLGRVDGTVSGVDLSLASDADGQDLRDYWAVVCEVQVVFETDHAAARVRLTRFATSAAASGQVTRGLSSGLLPGVLNALHPLSVLADQKVVDMAELAKGPVYATIVTRAPIGEGSIGQATRDLLLRAANASYSRIGSFPERDVDRPVREKLAPVWASIFLAFALLPTAYQTFFDRDRRLSLVIRWLKSLLRVLRLTGLSRWLGGDEETPPGTLVSARAQTVRVARLMTTLLSAASWAMMLYLALVVLSPSLSMAWTAILMAVVYAAMDAVKRWALGRTRTFRYLKYQRRSSPGMALLASLIDASYVGLVVFIAGKLSVDWLWVRTASGGKDSVRFFAYAWLLGPPAFIGASILLAWARRALQRMDAETILAREASNEILYLRSFQDENMTLPVHASLFESAGQMFSWERRLPFEEVLVRRLWRFGNVIAVGQPGRAYPPLGAARLYYADDGWQGPVRNWVASSRWIVVVMGNTAGLGWELDLIRELGALPKCVVVIPPVPDRDLRLRLLAEQLELSGAWVDYDGSKVPLMVVFDSDGSPNAIFGDYPDDVAYECALTSALAGREAQLRQLTP